MSSAECSFSMSAFWYPERPGFVCISFTGTGKHAAKGSTTPCHGPGAPAGPGGVSQHVRAAPHFSIDVRVLCMAMQRAAVPVRNILKSAPPQLIPA